MKLPVGCFILYRKRPAFILIMKLLCFTFHLFSMDFPFYFALECPFFSNTINLSFFHSLSLKVIHSVNNYVDNSIFTIYFFYFLYLYSLLFSCRIFLSFSFPYLSTAISPLFWFNIKHNFLSCFFCFYTTYLACPFPFFNIEDLSTIPLFYLQNYYKL